MSAEVMPFRGQEEPDPQSGADEPAMPLPLQPSAESREVSIQELLSVTLDMEGSDLHVTAGTAPAVRVHGDLKRLESYPVMTPEMLQKMIYAILTQKQREKFEQDLELDASYSLPGKARFRVNVYYQREAIGAAFRFIPFRIRSLEDLGLPPN